MPRQKQNAIYRFFAKDRCRIYVVLLWLAFTVIRTLLSYAAILLPKNLIDEMLYANLARSIAHGTGFLFRGQTADYTCMFYPIVLAPVYLIFPSGSNFYMIIQAYNAALMSLSVIPIYLLAREVTGDGKKSLLVAAISMLSADFALSGLIFSEAIVWPMMLTVFLHTYRYLKTRQLKDLLLVAVLGTLLFETKPGDIAPAVIALIVCLICTKQFRHFLVSLGVMAAVAAVFYVLFQRGSLFSLYAEQIAYNGTLSHSSLSDQYRALLRGIIYAPLAFFVACGGCCLVKPIAYFGKYSRQDRRFLACIFVSLAVMMVGTAWSVNRFEAATFAIHVRYVAMFIPVLLMMCLAKPAPEAELKDHEAGGAKMRALVPALCLIGLVIACVIVTTDTTVFFSGELKVAALASCFMQVLPGFVQKLVILLMAMLALYFIVTGNEKLMTRCGVALLAMVMVAGNIVFYPSYLGTHDDWIRKGARQAGEYLRDGGKDFNVVSGNTVYDAMYTMLDVNSRDDLNVTTELDFYNSISNTGGVYTPYLPLEIRGLKNVTETPVREYLAIDAVSYDYTHFTSDVQLVCGNDDDAMVVVRVPLEKRCVNDILGGFDFSQYDLNKGGDGYIREFTGLQSATLSFDIYVSAPCTLTAALDNGTVETINLEAGRHTYTVSLSGDLWLIKLTAPDAPVRIYGYSIAPNDAQ